LVLVSSGHGAGGERRGLGVWELLKGFTVEAVKTPAPKNHPSATPPLDTRPKGGYLF